MNNRDFEKICNLLPAGYTWGCSLTPDVTLYIVNAALASQSQQESQLPDISALKRIAKELKTYIPEADEYKGKFIHKVWAKEIESALPPSPEGDKP